MYKIEENITSSTLFSQMDANFQELLDKWDCEENSFREVVITQNGEEITKLLNCNFREYGFHVGMKGSEFITKLNKAYVKDLSRLQDYIAEHVVSGINRGEPSAIISDNGNRLDLLGTFFYTYSVDGLTFAPSCNISLSSDIYNNTWCLNFFKSNEKIYCTSVGVIEESGERAGIILWEEEDGTVWGDTSSIKRFVNPKIIVPYLTGGITNFGNTFSFFANNKWYLLIEGAGAIPGLGYQIYLAKSNTLDGTYTLVKNDPIIFEGKKDGVGNPEIAMVNNMPYKCDGKYFMYYHYHNASKGHAIYRAYSYNLEDWTIEGPILDTRVPPYREWTKTDGDGDLTGWSNGDQCTCEFKGHTYLFYTNNANQYIDNVPAPDPSKGEDTHIDMCIDYRPFSEILRIKP